MHLVHVTRLSIPRLSIPRLSTIPRRYITFPRVPCPMYTGQFHCWYGLSAIALPACQGRYQYGEILKIAVMCRIRIPVCQYNLFAEWSACLF